MVTSAFVRKFSDISASDMIAVGSKNAILGEIYSHLSSGGVQTPNGFALTSFAFEHFLTANALHQPLNELMTEIDHENYSNLEKISARARALILQGTIPYFIIVSVRDAYEELCHNEENPINVVVRSSASAENLPLAGFTNLYDSFMNIDNEDSLLDAIKKCFASLYSSHAIKYRVYNHLAHARLFFSVCVQKMVHTQNGCSGSIAESITGDMLDISAPACFNKKSVHVTDFPDHYLVTQSALTNGGNAIVKKRAGKNQDMHVTENNSPRQADYVLTDGEIMTLAQWAFMIGKHFNKQMDIEWMKDGKTNELYIIQAKPATVQFYNEEPSKQKYEAPVKNLISKPWKVAVN